ncbi:ribonuclease H-like domain-containing protein [Tanacetum coccineum]
MRSGAGSGEAWRKDILWVEGLEAVGVKKALWVSKVGVVDDVCSLVPTKIAHTYESPVLLHPSLLIQLFDSGNALSHAGMEWTALSYHRPCVLVLDPFWVKYSITTITNLEPPLASGNGPRMSMPQTGARMANGDSVSGLTTEKMLGLLDNLLTWSSKRQDTLSRYSAEAEYQGVANAVAKTSWIRNILHELYTPLFTATLVYCDNVSAVYMSANPVQHQCTSKHCIVNFIIHLFHVTNSS